jgi:hypothetical protein
LKLNLAVEVFFNWLEPKLLQKRFALDRNSQNEYSATTAVFDLSSFW